MFTDICAEIRNYFCQDCDKHFGEFTISGGSIAPLDFLKEGQYFRIIGSTFNDGIHQYPASDLTDEVFEGAVWAMAFPPSFIALAAEIKKYAEQQKGEASSYVSESFGGYSYTKATDENGAPITWERAFAKHLNKWRKI